MVRDDITAALYGAAFIGNNVLRVMADAMAGLAHHVLRYIDWLALQLLPDTAETEWLDRHGDIWLVNADGTVGRKMAAYATGTVTFTGNTIDGGTVIPAATQLSGGNNVTYETTEQALTAAGGEPVPVPIRALDAGVVGNLEAGSNLNIEPPIDGVTGSATVVSLTGGTDIENDDDLRIRVLERIRQPPQGGAAHDYVRWAKAVSGVTRAWVAPNEMGIGTVTVRVLMDDVRVDNDGFPFEIDLVPVTQYIDTVRPVAVKDFWVLAPLKQRIDMHINDLQPDTLEMRAAVEASLLAMLFDKAKPGQTIYAPWKTSAVMETPGLISFSTDSCDDDIMETPGHMAVLGDLIYDGVPA
jgi:uncharacterized phage protein gp47/JayE